jgi:hypothetical protein
MTAPLASRPTLVDQPADERLVPLISVEMIASGSGEPPIEKNYNVRLNRLESAPA